MATALPSLMATPACRPPGLPVIPAEKAGDKVAALLRLPPDWYPATLVVPVDVYRGWYGGSRDVGYLGHALPDELLSRALDHLPAARGEGLLVRSSAENESIAERGRYKSVPALSSPESVRLGVQDVWADATPAGSPQQPETAVAVAIQPKILTFAVGHMSNEHRVCRDATSWMVEGVTTPGVPVQWRVSGDELAKEGPLDCGDVAALRRQLRGVARWFAEQPYRHHLEWIWDGQRLWIVQCDRVPVEVGESPGDSWRATRGRAISPAALECWRAVDATSTASERWAKLECRRTFASAGLPVVDVFALTDQAALESLDGGAPSEALIGDLELLCDGDLIVRTDVASGAEGLMLPKTEAETDPAVIVEWMQNVTHDLQAEGVAITDIAFIAHRFLRSRACAWSYARPGDPVVRVDSIWGLNDGLSWLPHDTALVDVDSGEVSRTIRGKPTFLDVARDHHWRYRDTPTEWIWRASATEDQARTIGRGAHRLAEQLQQSVITMWFVGLLDGADSDCLPWFQATWETGRTENGPEAPSESAPRYVIASRADLEALPSSVLTGQVIQLKPDEELIRDKSFVDRIAEIAMERALLVEMDGSPLAHPFYMLRRAGVPVYCRTPIRITVSEQTPHNKLVRDHVPVLITEHGDHAVVYRADEIELRSRLRTKVVEEALELLAADTPEGELAEFADIFEVLQACVEATGFSTADVEVAQTQKRMERGGFEEGIVLVSTGEDDEPLVKEARTEALPGMPQSSSKRALITREGGGLDISLIPPERGDRSVYTMRLGDRIAEIRYFDSTVRLSIQPAASVQSAGFEQPDLWS